MPSFTTHKRLFDYDILWLRDTCRCEKCYHTGMSERISTVTSIPEDLDVANYKLDGNSLYVEWNDGHKSTYDTEVLADFKLNYTKAPKTELVLWNRESSEHINNCRIASSKLAVSEKTYNTALKMLATYGLVFIDGVAPTQKDTELITNLFFPCHKTFFGDASWMISNYDRTHKDSAYDDSYVGPHAEHSYFCDQSGAQVLHCLNHDGEGGESLFIDSFCIADKIKREHPETFERLCTVPVTFEYKEEGRHHVHTSPIFKLDPISKQVVMIRYNNADRMPYLPYTSTQDIRQFYNDLRILTQELESLENRMIIKLKPGTVAIFDNWRLLHGRYAFTGRRALAGIYIARPEFESKLRVSGFIN